MKKEEQILFIRNVNEKKVQKKEQSREKVINYFKWLASEHPNDNAIAKKMLEILPETEEITIPVDDKNRKNQYILYRIKGNTRMLEIPRNHKICWSKLKEFAAQI